MFSSIGAVSFFCQYCVTLLLFCHICVIAILHCVLSSQACTFCHRHFVFVSVIQQNCVIVVIVTVIPVSNFYCIKLFFGKVTEKVTFQGVQLVNSCHLSVQLPIGGEILCQSERSFDPQRVFCPNKCLLSSVYSRRIWVMKDVIESRIWVSWS